MSEFSFLCGQMLGTIMKDTPALMEYYGERLILDLMDAVRKVYEINLEKEGR